MSDQKLHDDIFATLPEDFIRRMRNWARAYDGASIMSSSAVYELIDNSRYGSNIPFMLGEVDDTDSALRKIPERYREAVETFWKHNSHTLTWMSRATPRLRLWKVGRATFRSWLDKGHELLQVEVIKVVAANRKRNEIAAQRTKEAAPRTDDSN